MSEKLAFDQAAYWKIRHKELAGDPRSVGNWGKSIEENLVGERDLQTIISAALTVIGSPGKALDLGCGYGRVAKQFIDAGWDYTGFDVSDVAIAEARRRVPGARLHVGDIDSLDNNETYDLVCVLYVFVHFVDDPKWESFLNTALSRVAVAGALLFADEFSDQRIDVAPHVVTRPLKNYEDAFGTKGFRIDKEFEREVKGLLPNLSVKGLHLARKL